MRFHCFLVYCEFILIPDTYVFHQGMIIKQQIKIIKKFTHPSHHRYPYLSSYFVVLYLIVAARPIERFLVI